MASEEVESFFTREYLPEAPAAVSAEFLEYISVNFLNFDSTFPPSMWADIATIDLKATTNCCESFHRHFGKFFFNSKKGKS